MKNKKNAINVIQKFSSEWINVYDIVDSECYTFVSRHPLEEIQEHKEEYCDAVRILPYFKENEKIYIVFANEFRPIARKRILNLPAGIVEKGENPLVSAAREVREEVGASILKIEEICPPCYTSVGMSDEKVATYFAEVALDSIQNLDENETIDVMIVSLEELSQIMSEKELDLGSRLLCLLFLEKYKKA